MYCNNYSKLNIVQSTLTHVLTCSQNMCICSST
nr:MAG TPA: hypothetical protein [Caudoviricetes sp.]